MSNADPLAHFTDREQQIAAFDYLWDRAAPWVLVFDGMAGNGKSTLVIWDRVLGRHDSPSLA
jgi:hypothetical protein